MDTKNLPDDAKPFQLDVVRLECSKWCSGHRPGTGRMDAEGPAQSPLQWTR